MNKNSKLSNFNTSQKLILAKNDGIKKNWKIDSTMKIDPNVDRSGSSSSVVGCSSSGVGSSSSSLPAVPCLASPSLQLNFSNL